MMRTLFLLVAAVSFVVAVPALAGERPRLLQVPAAYRQVAREYDVPPSLLFAIALTESGRSTTGGKVLPWPWTLNVAGRGYYFESRDDAEAFLARALRQGRYPDVGLMQVNWKYHQDKLGDASRACDPWLNLRAGALVLRQAFDRTGDWWKAVGRYHSATPALAEAYRKRVLRWHRRIG